MYIKYNRLSIEEDRLYFKNLLETLLEKFEIPVKKVLTSKTILFGDFLTDR